MAIVMSVSGNSPNLVKAIEWCKQKRVLTIALLGGQRRKLAALADTVLVIDETHFGRVEDWQLHICHMIAFAFYGKRSIAAIAPNTGRSIAIK